MKYMIVISHADMVLIISDCNLVMVKLEVQVCRSTE